MVLAVSSAHMHSRQLEGKLAGISFSLCWFPWIVGYYCSLARSPAPFIWLLLFAFVHSSSPSSSSSCVGAFIHASVLISRTVLVADRQTTKKGFPFPFINNIASFLLFVSPAECLFHICNQSFILSPSTQTDIHEFLITHCGVWHFESTLRGTITLGRHYHQSY